MHLKQWYKSQNTECLHSSSSINSLNVHFTFVSAPSFFLISPGIWDADLLERFLCCQSPSPSVKAQLKWHLQEAFTNTPGRVLSPVCLRFHVPNPCSTYHMESSLMYTSCYLSQDPRVLKRQNCLLCIPSTLPSAWHIVDTQ